MPLVSPTELLHMPRKMKMIVSILKYKTQRSRATNHDSTKLDASGLCIEHDTSGAVTDPADRTLI
jgi:hypothetical protein